MEQNYRRPSRGARLVPFRRTRYTAIAAAEKFFAETMGVTRFMHIDNLAAKDT
jgi:hypothetical protein